ncbi:DUF4932 domain-containing protein [Chryseobacterium sp. MYb264]|uniref:DUF4932 domain-containing protein n=1 Tax=Chryseobacterium sp. MYb264 TaxID=2745153 RepID=UPI002E13E732|nr:DUF4932 domain-containing protein [Chryseobacterium sp. MYb264]
MKRIILLLSLLLNFVMTAQETRQIQFDEKFKKEYQGSARIEINELKELLHIMIAITEAGLENDDMIQQNGEYYQDVLQHFKKYGNEKIIIKFDSLIKANPLNYVFLTGNGTSYDFKNNQLVANTYYLFPAQSVSGQKITVNPITTYKKEIEDFALTSGFRKFYKAHLPYYKSIISMYHKQANLDEQWKWLEKNFNTKINSYLILCSPLINGFNYTDSYKDKDFKQIVMVLPPIEEEKSLSEKENIVLNTRGMFTEIDHNYVGTPTKKYIKEIEEALKDREKWVNTKQEGTQYYPNPEKVFDEYMTYAAFYLFCVEKFENDQKTLDHAYYSVNQVMKERGFPKMKEFNDGLLAMKKKHPNEKIDDFYPAFIQWLGQL